jgi:Alkylmercury lyase/Pyridine nucleotide-disulphide oxidoreductase/Helix-turn-helix domain of alkylmercury lyase
MSGADDNEHQYDLAIVGSGGAAFAGAIAARRRELPVAMIERETIGGTCVNVGCIPSKALLAAAEARHRAGVSRFPGISTQSGAVDFTELIAGKREIVEGMRQRKYLDLADEYGIELIDGHARFVDGPVLDVDGRRLQAARYLVATGSEPYVADIPGLRESGYLTSTTAMELDHLPASMIVLGRGRRRRGPRRRLRDRSRQHGRRPHRQLGPVRDDRRGDPPRGAGVHPRPEPALLLRGMTIRPDTPSLEAVAESLAGTFPGSDDAPLARALLRELTRGHPVSAAALATSTGRDDDDVTTTLARWPNVRRDQRGRVEAFGGLSLRPTKHRLDVGGRRLYTWCAWDTLFLPALLGDQAQVEATCPMTGTEVRLTVAPDRALAAHPEDVWVSFPAPEGTTTDEIVESFCCHVHFLAGADSADRWASAHPGTFALGLADAFELGRLATRAFFTASGDG